MYGRAADLGEIAALQESLAGPAATNLDVLLCPPMAYVPQAVWGARKTAIQIGAQDCSVTADDSARTGDVSAAMLADIGARYVIVGHSERRTLFQETDAIVRAKAEAALGAKLIPIVCVGETKAERDGGRVAEIVARQVRDSVPQTSADLVVAYEPVWAIGGASTPSLSEIAEVHAIVRATLAERVGARAGETRILYGGSVNPQNAAGIFGVDGVDGALVGRASLKARDFSAIIQAHPAAS
jgi:triosephosphate isomerase